MTVSAGVQLEVTVLHLRDVAGAVEGGADRLFLTAGGLSPAPADVSAAVRESDLPLRVMLRLSEHRTTNGGEFSRLVALAEEYVALGAEGVSFGFLDSDLRIDVGTCRALAQALPGVPWTLSRAIDDTLEPARSWRQLAGLPGLDAVHSAGSPRGLDGGYDDLLALAEADPAIAALLVPSGGLRAEMVPWFVRAGVTRFHVEEQVRPGASDKAYVDAGHVRSWRLLLDADT
ncbi:copper homeostasis protein CutC [Nocardioides sp.]|uniref:copper homeostasis protein CutC n=1 Tax=Nocardioides sp. TaxID=35761 RepID=UPI003D151BFA